MFASPAIFLLAVVLLWFPRRWMRLGKTIWRRRRVRRLQEPWKRREPGDPRLSFWEESGKTRNWFDLLRAAAGSLALLGGHGIEASVQPVEGEPRSRVIVLGIQFAVLFVGLMIQVIRKERGRASFFAPVFFLTGVAVGLCGAWTAAFAFVLVWAVNPMLANAGSFLMVQGMALAAFGFMLKGVGDVRPLFAGLLCLTPAILSLLLRRPLVVFSRRASPDGADAS